MLLLTEEERQAMVNVVAECAARTYHQLRRALQPGTPEAFRGYVAALHQLYLMGMSMELKRLGYHMTKWG